MSTVFGADAPDGPCDPSFADGFDDIHAGTQVTVYDSKDEIIATSNLVGGSIVNAEAYEVEDFDLEPVMPEFSDDPDAPLPDMDSYWAEYEAWQDNPVTKTVYRGACQLTFEAEVGDASFYAVEVSNRGRVNYAKADLEAAGWTVALVL